MSMTQANEFAPGLFVSGFVPPKPLADFRLLAFGMDSALLYPGAEELVDACKASGLQVELALGEIASAAEKRDRLEVCCHDLGIGLAQVLYVGKATSDLALLQFAGLGVAYRAAPEVADQANVSIQTGGLDRLLAVLTQTTADAPPRLDLGVLDALVGNDASKFRKFAQLFMSSVGGVMAEVDTAIAQEDMHKLAAMGHRAKSTALNVGAHAFATQCIGMENAARVRDVATALALAKGLRPLFDEIGHAFAQRLVD
jgi:HPt (histidine-containing phosphotransfer) domain-containing protein